ncbi:hypothetical protein HY382_02350 [Candidatus Curtissbacteria bacterium]|nr:hypothetical protein [Candidatus Curtissbacteria bacterium]
MRERTIPEREISFVERLEALADEARAFGSSEIELCGYITEDFYDKAMNRDCAEDDPTQALIEQFLEETGNGKKLRLDIERPFLNEKEFDRYMFVRRSNNGD